MVAEVTTNYDWQWAAINAVAQKLGVGTAKTVRKWVCQGEIDAGQRPGTPTDESAELAQDRPEPGDRRHRSGCSGPISCEPKRCPPNLLHGNERLDADQCLMCGLG